MLKDYQLHVQERAALQLPPLPLNAEQVAAVVELLKNPPKGEEALLVDLIENQTPAGVDQAAYVKAAFLASKHGKDYEKALLDRWEVRSLGGGCPIPFAKEFVSDKTN